MAKAPGSGSFFSLSADAIEDVRAREDSGRSRRIREPETPPAVPGDPRIGTTLVGRYRLSRLIGRGGMGRVYLATQIPLGREVAIKILNPEFQEKDPQFVRRFFLEAATSARLNHPNSITVYDYGETEARELFIAMEYLNGQPLSRVLALDGPFSAERAIYISVQIARALREAHHKGIIHRDLKPGNIMLVHGGDVPDFAKVLDFGLVKLFHVPGGEPIRFEDVGPEIREEGELTRAGTFLGSPKYMSPEQIKGHDVDPRTDIYSLGVLMYQMVAGRVPFRGASALEIIFKHVNESVPPVHEVNPEADCPPELELVIQRSLMKKREDRFASMGDLLSALKETRRLILGISSHSHASSEFEISAKYPIRDTAQVTADMPPGMESERPASRRHGSRARSGEGVPSLLPETPSVAGGASRPPSPGGRLSADRESFVRSEVSFSEAHLSGEDSQARSDVRGFERSSSAHARRVAKTSVVGTIGMVLLLVVVGVVAYIVSSPSDKPKVAAPKSMQETQPTAIPGMPKRETVDPATVKAEVEAETAVTPRATVRFAAVPDGADVYAAGVWLGTTPFDRVFEVSTQAPHERTFVFKKAGFEDATVQAEVLGETVSIVATLRPVSQPAPSVGTDARTKRTPSSETRTKRDSKPTGDYKENPY